MRKAVVVGARLDVIRVINEYATRTKRVDVRFVAVLVEHHEHVGTVASGQDVAGAHAHLKNGRPPRDCGRNRHVGHDVLIAAPG
jgi:hypothetical protein